MVLLDAQGVRRTVSVRHSWILVVWCVVLMRLVLTHTQEVILRLMEHQNKIMIFTPWGLSLVNPHLVYLHHNGAPHVKKPHLSWVLSFCVAFCTVWYRSGNGTRNFFLSSLYYNTLYLPSHVYDSILILLTVVDICHPVQFVSPVELSADVELEPFTCLNMQFS